MCMCVCMGYPGGSAGKESACNVGDSLLFLYCCKENKVMGQQMAEGEVYSEEVTFEQSPEE